MKKIFILLLFSLCSVQTFAESIESLNTFDGFYIFTLVEPPVTELGYGILEINKGIITMNKDTSGMVASKYESFKGLIDKNGDILATFYFHPCIQSGCGLKDKLVEFDGNINNKKLSGMYKDRQIYFYLSSKQF